MVGSAAVRAVFLQKSHSSTCKTQVMIGMKVIIQDDGSWFCFLLDALLSCWEGKVFLTLCFARMLFRPNPKDVEEVDAWLARHN